MYGKERGLHTALSTAFVLAAVAALTLVLTAALLARAGMPFTAAYTVSILAAVIGTLAVSRGGRTLLALPSPAVTAWLVYEEIIARGLSWQEMLGIAAVTSCVGMLLTRTKYADAWTRALPPIVRTGLVLGLGCGMLTAAALYARILLPSPWALSMGGTLSDPLTYFTLTGILLVLVLHARNVRTALPLGMVLIGALTWAEGFWEIPPAPFLMPDLGGTAGALTLAQSDPFAAAGLGLTLLLALLIESMAVLAAEAEPITRQQPLAPLFGVSGCMSLLGAFPLTIAPISAALPEASEDRRIAGIPLTACLTALLLLLLLPCAVLMQALADFPAVPAIALAVLGLMLLVRALQMLPRAAHFTLREGAVIAAFILAAYDVRTGLTLALFLFTLLTAAHGERATHATWGLTVLFSLFFLIQWIR